MKPRHLTPGALATLAVDMDAESDPLSKLAADVADGEPINWDALDLLEADEGLRKLVAHLRAVAGIADVHRSQAGDGGATTGLSPAHPTVGGPSAGSDRWGHLVLVRKIGEGAFGEVFLAHDTWLDHPRALKLIKPRIASRIAHDELLHEARKLVRVRHPNVVTVHGADRHDGRVGFWMDFIEGRTLADRVREGRLSAGEAMSIGRELCHALAAVHLAHLIHRDVKAQNVMRSADDGRIILMDFGAGEFVDAPVPGRPQGTPLYTAPELFGGTSATVQSDVYAVGVLLYHLVTGRFPVSGASIDELIEAHRAGRRQRLRDSRLDLPDDFVDAVERALDPEPGRRFRSSSDLRDALGVSGVATITTRDDRHDASRVDGGSVALFSRALIVGALSLVTIEAVGFLSWRTFELVLNVDPAFAAPVTRYFRLGVEALIPFALYWLGGAAGLAVLNGVDVVVGAPLQRYLEARVAGVETAGASRAAATICLAGAAAWAALIATHWQMFNTMFEVQNATSRGVAAAGLDPTFKAVVLSYSNWSAWLAFALVAATVLCFPALERRCAAPSALRPFRWATLTIVILAVCTAVAPRRLVYDSFDIVLFDRRPYFVIAGNDEQLLIYEQGQNKPTTLHVRRDNPALTFASERRTLVGQ